MEDREFNAAALAPSGRRNRGGKFDATVHCIHHRHDDDVATVTRMRTIGCAARPCKLEQRILLERL